MPESPTWYHGVVPRELEKEGKGTGGAQSRAREVGAGDYAH